MARAVGVGRPKSAPRRNSRLSAIVAIVIVVVALGVLLGTRLLAGSSREAGIARVTDGEGNVYEMPLDTDDTKTVTTSLGTNVVEVKDGRVRVREADCPNQDCVNQGWIDSSSQQIVCLPHKLCVDVINGEASDVDVVGR